MRRDYDAMHAVLAIVVWKGSPAKFGDFVQAVGETSARVELRRLSSDGLVDNGIAFTDGNGFCLDGEISGLTDEGARFCFGAVSF